MTQVTQNAGAQQCLLRRCVEHLLAPCRMGCVKSGTSFARATGQCLGERAGFLHPCFPSPARTNPVQARVKWPDSSSLKLLPGDFIAPGRLLAREIAQ